MPGLNTVLIASDLSDRAERAETRAAMLCAEHQCSHVELLTVRGPEQPDVLAQVMNSTVESARALLTEQAEQSLRLRSAALKDDYGVQCAYTVRFGRSAVEIESRADEIDADIVAIGAHGGNFFSDLLLGNTANKLMQLCKRPLLIVKNQPQVRQTYRHVLVPVDFSEDAKQAAKWALKIAPEADITFLHAFEALFEGQMQYANVPSELISNYRIKAREEARLKLNQFIVDLNAETRYLHRVITFGMPGPVVREHAKTMRPDLIVMGKHGRSRIAELIIGSVTRDTSDQTEADLLVVPATATSA